MLSCDGGYDEGVLGIVAEVIGVKGDVFLVVIIEDECCWADEDLTGEP